MNLVTPLTPKNPNGPLRVITIGRVSQSTQNIENCAASHLDVERWLRSVYQGVVELRTFGEQGSGLLASRPQIDEAEALIESGEWDVVILEDISRAYRNPQFQWAFVHLCVDSDTRCICIADNIDTADDNWEAMMVTATARHGLYVPDTRRRVRRTANYAFERGGMVQKLRYGYRKLTKEDADSGRFGPVGLRMAKLPECTPIIRAMRDRIVSQNASGEDVARWLNDEGVPPGPQSKKGKWTGALVLRLMRCPLISGRRTFRVYLHKPIRRTGKYRRVKNPKGPEVREYQELAHLTREEHDELLRVLDSRRRTPKRPPGQPHPLTNRPRTRSPWPGQHARCGICGGLMYRFGKYLKCSNAVSSGSRTCWNHVQVDCSQTRKKVLAWVLSVLEADPAYRELMIDAAWKEFDRRLCSRQTSSTTLEAELQELKKQAKRLAKIIAKGGKLKSLLSELGEVEDRIEGLEREKRRLADMHRNAASFQSRAEVAARLDDALQAIAERSLDFADLLRRLIPEFVIVPVQALDRPQVHPRAKLTLNLTPWCDPDVSPPTISATIDLFDPPGYIAVLDRVVAARRADPRATLKQLAAQLGINHMAVKRALDYARRMEAAGQTNPYRELYERPADASRWRYFDLPTAQTKSA